MAIFLTIFLAATPPPTHLREQDASHQNMLWDKKNVKSVVKLQLCLDEVSEKEHDQTNNNEKMKRESELLCSYRRNEIAGCLGLKGAFLTGVFSFS